MTASEQRRIEGLERRLSQIERNVEPAPSRTHGVGEVWAYAGVDVPSGSLIADGSAVSRTTYPALFAALRTDWGAGDGKTTFNLPDLRGRAPVGADGGQSEFNRIGNVGGAKTHRLTESEMPSHTHRQNAHNHTQNDHDHGGLKVGSAEVQWTGGYQTSSGNRSGIAAGASNFVTGSARATNNSTTATNQNTGGGAEHNNLQPYAVVRYLIAF
jgi:microcystin-dependent protein